MPSPDELASDPAWLPWAYDAPARRLTFVHAPAQTQRSATFLDADGLRPALADAAKVASAPVDEIGEALSRRSESHPLHFIFHSAFCCSTLMARALDFPGCFTLKEPAIVNVMASLAYAGKLDRQVLALVLALLARPLDGAVMIVKPSNEANVIAATMLAARPEARALFMSNTIEDFLGSIDAKGLWGRAWVRRIFARDRGTAIDLVASGEAADFENTDLQIAGRYWLGQRVLACQLARQFGNRVASLDADTFVAAPGQVIAQVCGFLGIEAPADGAHEHGASVFARDAKRGDVVYDPQSRTADQAGRRAANADEKAMVAKWIDAVAQHARVSVALPNPLS